MNARNPVPANLSNVQSLGNGVVRFSFINNTNTAATFTVLSSTDLSLPATNWTSVGVATNSATNFFEFTSPATPADAQRFYIIRVQVILTDGMNGRLLQAKRGRKGSNNTFAQL